MMNQNGLENGNNKEFIKFVQAIKRIRILENLVGTGSSPAWMILTILPVIPPALERPRSN
jgi:DNA-directed RNA polymerase beta' subunit